MASTLPSVTNFDDDVSELVLVPGTTAAGGAHHNTAAIPTAGAGSYLPAQDAWSGGGSARLPRRVLRGSSCTSRPPCGMHTHRRLTWPARSMRLGVVGGACAEVGWGERGRLPCGRGRSAAPTRPTGPGPLLQHVQVRSHSRGTLVGTGCAGRGGAVLRPHPPRPGRLAPGPAQPCARQWWPGSMSHGRSPEPLSRLAPATLHSAPPSACMLEAAQYGPYGMQHPPYFGIKMLGAVVMGNRESSLILPGPCLAPNDCQCRSSSSKFRKASVR